MDSIRVENLRSLKDTGFIDIKPLTLLLGQNSSGKSTFLRCYPLMRQSVAFDTKTRSPIAWNGRFVDFGSFNEAVRHQAKPAEITFHFRFNIDLGAYSRRGVYYSDDYYVMNNMSNKRRTPTRCPIQVSTGISRVNEFGVSVVSTFEMILAKEHRIIIQMPKKPANQQENSDSPDSFVVVNDRKFSQQNTSLTVAVGDHVVPYLVSTDERKISSRSPYYRRFFEPDANLYAKIEKSVVQLGGKLAAYRVAGIVRAYANGFLRVGTSEQMFTELSEYQGITPTWRKKMQKSGFESASFSDFKDHMILLALPNMLEAARDAISATFNQSRYIGPVRATAERHYRIQDFVVDEIDTLGRNMAAFLSALTPKGMESFQDWTLENFGFRPSVEPTGSHLMLQVSYSSESRPSNLADMGFGFSQVLPVITQLWALLYPREAGLAADGSILRSPNMPVTFCIEQPELHLHPRLQSQLIAAFAKAVLVARNSHIDMRILLETHSETMINTLGRLISHGKISSDLVNIVLFDHQHKESSTQVKFSGYDSDGFLENWPMGFFEGDVTSQWNFDQETTKETAKS